MPDVTLSGAWGLTLENWETFLSASTVFQGWSGSIDAPEAKAKIHIDATDSWTRPAALIVDSERIARRVSKGSGDDFDLSGLGGSLFIVFEKDANAAHAGDEKNERKDFREDVESIIEDLIAVAGIGTNPSFRSASYPDPPQRATEEGGKEGGVRFYQWVWEFGLD